MNQYQLNIQASRYYHLPSDPASTLSSQESARFIVFQLGVLLVVQLAAVQFAADKLFVLLAILITVKLAVLIINLFAVIFANLLPVVFAVRLRVQLAEKMFRNESLDVQLKAARENVDFESYKIKSKLVMIKQEQNNNLMNIEKMILAEARQIIDETQKASKETYRHLENEGCENIINMDDTLEKLQNVSRCSTEEKVKLVQETNIMLQKVSEFSSNLELRVKINREMVKAATEK